MMDVGPRSGASLCHADVFITAYADETVRPSVLEQGAVECLFKPFSDTALRDALDAALHVA